jgi:hypothetical protein
MVLESKSESIGEIITGFSAKQYIKLQIFFGIILFAQSALWFSLFNLLISLPLETLWPTLTMPMTYYIQGYGIWNFSVGALSIIISACLWVQKSYQCQKSILLLQWFFIITGFLLLPFGPIMTMHNTYILKHVQRKSNSNAYETIENKMYPITFLMGIITNLIIGGIGIAAGFLIKSQQVDLVYPYFTPNTMIFFRIMGIFFIAIAVGDIFIAFGRKIWMKFNLTKAIPSTLKKLGMIYKYIHVLAFPMGTFLVIL